jgi:hypothetical protein
MGVAFTPLAAKEPDACGKPDNWSVSCRPSSSSTCDTTASLKQGFQLSPQEVKDLGTVGIPLNLEFFLVTHWQQDK